MVSDHDEDAGVVPDAGAHGGQGPAQRLQWTRGHLQPE